MAAPETILLQRAAGAVLRGLKRRGASPQQRGGIAMEPLRPALAIDALLAAMRSQFSLSDRVADELLRPALADWRDAVGCADPVLVPLNAQEPSAEKHLLPIPIPSWCTSLVDAGVLLLDGAPLLEGPRVVQRARLAVVRETELAAVECFPLVFAGRYGAGAPVRVHLALSPPFLAAEWRGSLCLRAGARRVDDPGLPVPIWLGAPASPGLPSAGTPGQTAVTWTMPRGDNEAPDWPAGWPRWAVLRVREGREPQALWSLPALWRASTAMAPEAALASPASTAPGTLRLAVDIGSTSTVVVEEDSAAGGSVGAKLLASGAPRNAPSGFRRLAGDAATAHQVGCAEHLVTPGGQIPTALVAPSLDAVADLLRHGSEASDQLWLPQAGAEGGIEPFRIDRFKSPELLLLSDWLAELPPPLADRGAASQKLLRAFAYQVGRALAAAHGTPLISPEGGRWAPRRPRLASAEAVLTYPECAFDSAGSEPFERVFEEAAAELCRGLAAAWEQTSHRLVPDPAAARAARGRAEDDRHPIEAYVDFGGLTVQVTVQLPHAAGRPAPFIARSSTSYLLGGERLLEAAALASADRDDPEAVRDRYRSIARRWRTLIGAGGRLQEAEAAQHRSVADALLRTVLEIVQRQLQGTLRRAAPDGTGLRGAGVRLYLIGEGWKLAALDVEDESREAESVRRIEETLRRSPLLAGPVQLQRMTKRRVCEGALRVRRSPDPPEPPLELMGVDVGTGEGLRQRWYGLADPARAADPDLLPRPEDPWWNAFAGGAGSLLRVEQWFSGPPDTSPFQASLAGGNLAFDSRRSVLKQWLDVSGPSLVALRIRKALPP
jgi:hypothetical protein